MKKDVDYHRSNALEAYRDKGEKINFGALERGHDVAFIESWLTTIVLGFLAIYILFGVDDPIEVYDKLVWLIQRYSQLCHWVTEIWDKLTSADASAFDSNGILMWIISKITGKEITFVELIKGIFGF